jgi:hypothetical protein
MNAGEFTLMPAVTGFDFVVRPPGGTLNPANLYMVRFFSPPGEHGSSVNQPGDFLTGGAVDAGFTSQVLPGSAINADNDKIVIIPADPVIRRAPQLDQGTLEDLHGGYDDFLKDNGNEFTPSMVGGQTYPYAVIQKVANPGAIPNDAVQSDELQEETNPHRIVVDVLGFVDPDTTAETWSYKVFGAPVILGDLNSRPVITEGSFTVNPPPGIGNSPLVGVNFGINIFDDAGEGDADLANLNSAYYADKNLSIATLPIEYGSDTPNANDVDVLFVQFSGGEIDPVGQSLNPFEGFSNFSNKVILDNGLGGVVTKTLDIRVAGVGASDIDFIGLGHLYSTDAGPGGLVGGLDYSVSLDDPTNPGIEYTFAPDMLVVSN